jgi:hypothetical protein
MRRTSRSSRRVVARGVRLSHSPRGVTAHISPAPGAPRSRSPSPRRRGASLRERAPLTVPRPRRSVPSPSGRCAAVGLSRPHRSSAGTSPSSRAASRHALLRRRLIWRVRSTMLPDPVRRGGSCPRGGSRRGSTMRRSRWLRRVRGDGVGPRSVHRRARVRRVLLRTARAPALASRAHAGATGASCRRHECDGELGARGDGRDARRPCVLCSALVCGCRTRGPCAPNVSRVHVLTSARSVFGSEGAIPSGRHLLYLDEASVDAASGSPGAAGAGSARGRLPAPPARPARPARAHETEPSSISQSPTRRCVRRYGRAGAPRVPTPHCDTRGVRCGRSASDDGDPWRHHL